MCLQLYRDKTADPNRSCLSRSHLDLSVRYLRYLSYSITVYHTVLLISFDNSHIPFQTSLFVLTIQLCEASISNVSGCRYAQLMVNFQAFFLARKSSSITAMTVVILCQEVIYKPRNKTNEDSAITNPNI